MLSIYCNMLATSYKRIFDVKKYGIFQIIQLIFFNHRKTKLISHWKIDCVKIFHLKIDYLLENENARCFQHHLLCVDVKVLRISFQQFYIFVHFVSFSLSLFFVHSLLDSVVFLFSMSSLTVLKSSFFYTLIVKRVTYFTNLYKLF